MRKPKPGELNPGFVVFIPVNSVSSFSLLPLVNCFFFPLSRKSVWFPMRKSLGSNFTWFSKSWVKKTPWELTVLRKMLGRWYKSPVNHFESKEHKITDIPLSSVPNSVPAWLDGAPEFICIWTCVNVFVWRASRLRLMMDHLFPMRTCHAGWRTGK